MKRQIISGMVLCCSLAACIPSAGTIWRVNNNPGVTADFTTVQAAHDAAGIGDTLYLEPTVSNYGNLAMTKRLTIISTGFFLDVNPDLQASLTPGSINTLTMVDVNATGSVFHCNISSVTVNGPDNLRFERCRVQFGLSATGSDNLICINNFIGDNLSIISGSQNAVVSNNIVRYLSMSANGSATISNNVLNFNSTTSSTLYNATFQNNIINKAANITFNNCIVLNNLSASTTLPAGNNNVNSVDMSTVFDNPNGSNDVAFKLKSGGGNPAVGAGVGGVDCGAYGGSTPFVSGLQPAIPGIYKLAVPASASGNTMNIIFSTRSNN